MLAPDDSVGNNQGKYEPGEQTGNLRKEYAARLAPIMDALIDADALVIATEWSEFRTPDFSNMISLLKNKMGAKK